MPTGSTAHADDEAALFTPPGFQSVGLVKVAEGADTGLLNVTILDRKTGRPTFCRINVVGPDGHYYQPLPDYLTPYALTGQWPKTGRGNRLGKGPFRYYGRFFYSTGRSTVRVPAEGHPADFAARSLSNIGDAGTRTHSEEELKEYLKPVPPKSAEESLESFETVDGFRMELVAAEPLVVDPIAAAFDENGNLYVAEMRDYPYVPKEGDKPLGTLRLLIDTDGDGRFDQSHVFAEHLLWAAGVAPWKGGVYVAAPPDIWYLKDTDGDHRADVRQKIYTGFGTSNQQAMVNNLKFGLDHKIYGTTAGNGGTIRPADNPGAEGISVNGRDFRFDPVSGLFETISGTVQFGHTMDDWGNRFLCNQAKPLHHVVLPQRYLARNPYLAVSKVIQNIAPGPVPIYRISPIERWRHIRSSRRIAHSSRAATASGASQHVIDAAAGSTVYRGGAYPEEYYGNVFVGGSQHNLIHRRVLTPDGVTFRSSRADQRTEFVRSSDNWFRPVNFVNAPDGTLYVLDMSREIIESIHIPIDVVEHLDLTVGRDRGHPGPFGLW